MGQVDRNIVGWFEIPVSDMERSIKFYEAVLGLKLTRNTLGGLDMAWFPMEDVPGAPGSLVYNQESYRPSTDGVLIYLSSPTGDLQNELSKIETAGGKVLQKKTLISEDIGYMALFTDSEGNKLALHSRK